jgi:hypothetical protein
MIWAMTGEPVAPSLDRLRLDFRGALAAVLAMRIDAAIAGGHLPAQDSNRVAAALVGALLESLAGPLAPPPAPDAGAQRAAVQTATLLALRALGVADARARGLVVQCALPGIERVA